MGIEKREVMMAEEGGWKEGEDEGGRERWRKVWRGEERLGGVRGTAPEDMTGRWVEGYGRMEGGGESSALFGSRN